MSMDSSGELRNLLSNLEKDGNSDSADRSFTLTFQAALRS